MKTKKRQLFWRIGRGAFGLQRMATVLVLLATFITAQADRMKDNDYFTSSNQYDHIHFSLLAADLKGANSFSKSGTIKAICGDTTYEILKIHSTGNGNDSGNSWNVYGYDPNDEDWGGVCYITNPSSGSATKVDLGDSDNNYTVKKGEKDNYPTIEIDFYWPASMAGKTWTFKYDFYHDQNGCVPGGNKSMKLGSHHLGYTASDFGYKTVNTGGFKYNRTAMDKIQFIAPSLPSGDIPDRVKDYRKHAASYDLTFTYTMPKGEKKTVEQTGLVCKENSATYEIAIPADYQKFTRLDMNVKSTEKLMNKGDKYYWLDTHSYPCPDLFPNAPQPKGLTAEYRQFDGEAVLTWEAFSTGDTYIHGSEPYVYRMQVDEKGNPVSGASWQKRGKLKEIGTTQRQTYTDNKDLTSGTYYKYMVMNVPKEWINHGVSQTDLNSPTDELLKRLPNVESGVMSTKPQVGIFNLQQDLTHTTDVRLTWRYTRVPVKGQTVTFKVMRRTSEEEGWKVYSDEVSAPSNPKDNELGSFIDKDLPNNKVRYDYKVVLELNGGGDTFESDVCKAGLIEGTTVQGITASKGTNADMVRVTWNAKQVGTGKNTYMLYRRYAESNEDYGEYIYSTYEDATQFVYEDKSALPGYYYEYKVEIRDADGNYQNTLTDVGFRQTRGSINGSVTFENGGNAVENVRIDLVASDDNGSAIRGYSKRFDGASTGVQWEADSAAITKLFGPGKDYTVQMFVRPDSLLSEGAVIGEIPGEGRLVLGNMSNGEYDLLYGKVTWGEPEWVPPVMEDNTPVDLSKLKGDYEAKNGDVLTGKLGGNYKISIADGATVKIKDAYIGKVHWYDDDCMWAGLTCPGDATLVMEGQSSIIGFGSGYPGIYIAEGKTLTIKGQGHLSADGLDNAAPGIGSTASQSCGNIVIQCAELFVYGGENSAAIGSGNGKDCGNITIKRAFIVARGYYTGGIDHDDPDYKECPWIGAFGGGMCGTVTIDETIYWDGNKYVNGGENIMGEIFYDYYHKEEWDNDLSNSDPVFTHVAEEGYTIYPRNYDNIATGVKLAANTYSLLTVSKTGDNLQFQVGDSISKTLTANKSARFLPFSVGGANDLDSLQGFRGNITEVRVWDHALTSKEQTSYADRTLNGYEDGLRLYWPMDEGLNHHVYDASYASDQPNGRHATVGSSVSTSAILPTQEQLSRYGLTNSKGEYKIHGIPFTGKGTTYRVVPQLGIHEFNPTSRAMFISTNSLDANNVDFNDKSSFPMDGYIYYQGTNIPVEGVMFYIDNQLVTGQGEAKQTDANGYYSISVPIGEHYVEARKEGHTFVAGGRYPTKNTYNFDRAVTYDFADNTLVNFVGRVGGGERNDSLPVGFAQSVNNIGMATIQLRLNNESFSFNCADDHLSQATKERTWNSDTTSVNSRAWTGIGDESRYINIRTDSITGEFSALLPPLKYTIKSVTLLADEKALADDDPDTNPSGIEFITGQEVDMTQPKVMRADTLEVTGEDGLQEKRPYHYHAKNVFTHFAQPQLDIVERDNAEGVFGLRAYSEVTAQGDTLKIDNLWTLAGDGKPQYLLDYPVYQMGDKTEYRFTAYEEYVNRDGKKPVVQHIPLAGQVVNVVNEMADDQSIVYQVPEGSLYAEGDVYDPKTHGCKLDENGEGIYKWGAGLPYITSPFTRHLTVSMQRNGRTYILNELDAIVLGNITLGNNFVTKGPDVVDFVLRDPPGAKSKTTLKRAKITRTETLKSYGFYDKSSGLSTWMCGISLESGTGTPGFMIFSSTVAKADIKAGVNWETTHNSLEETTTTTTYSNAISTSASSPYISTQGDVYVGTSTNILIGQCRLLHVVKKDDGKYGLQVDMARSFGNTVATSFMYSQYELQTVMIPKWKDQRNGFMATAIERADSAAAYAYTNDTDKGIYVRWNKPGDADYGIYKYRWVAPDTTKVKEPEVDSVAWCTNQIQLWEAKIRQNEEDKVKSMQAENGFKNFSIDGGSTYTFSERTENMKVTRTTIYWKVGAVTGIETGIAINKSLGVNLSLIAENGKQWTDGSGNDEGDYTEWEYTIQDGNRDTDISINQYDPQNDKYTKFFSVFGGQTYNPYHAADSTIYYTPKTQLNAATEQMEQPDLGVSLDGNTPQKNITVTDIPAGGEANLTLHCTNLATAHQGVNFSYNLVVLENTNQNGLQILMDGVPINGRSIMLNQSETSLKRITIRQTDQSLLTYEGIKLRFCSQYQPAKINDEVTINAYFKPWSSNVDLAIDEPVLNTQSKEGLLQMRLKNYDRQFKNLQNVGVEYRFEGNTQWTNLHTWWTSPKDTAGVSNELLKTNDIYYAVNMESNTSYPEGTYEFRAYTTTPYDHEDVRVYSDVITVIKDLTRPRNLYTPSPSNGILRYGDQMAIEFNEDIVPGYVSPKNVIVTAKLNSQEVQHDVAYQLLPIGNQPKTVNPVFLKGDFSMDFWLNWHQAGTIVHLGKSINADGEESQGTNFALSIGDDNRVQVRVAGNTFTSEKTVPKDKWTFMALSFNATDMTFDMLAQYDTVTVRLFQNKAVPKEVVQAVSYTDDNHLYLGYIHGEMHALSLYNIYRDVSIAASEKYKAKDNYVYGLANYWPMDEGHGTVAADTRHTHDFTVEDSWILENKNYSLRIDDKDGAQADISTIATTRGDSYAIEMWYHNNGDKDEVVFETAIPTVAGDFLDKESKLCLRFDSVKNVVLDYGKKSQIVASYEDFPNLTKWHHYALNVVRGQAASFYLDGKRTAVIAEADMPSISGSSLVVGRNNTAIAYADELRIWHAALSESRLLQNMYNTIDTADVYSRGLVAYYPFEKIGEVNGVTTKVPTMEDMAPRSVLGGSPTEMHYHANALFEDTPPLKNAPDETRLIASPIASERKVVINLTGAGLSPRDIEGTTLNITVDQVHDLHGNTSLPIRWTAYVQQNTLKWTKDSVNIIKKYGDDYTFDVTIENKSGNTEYYTLYNMPQWLSLVDSEQSDEVAPLSTKVLRFQVNPLVAVGNYDLNIGLQGNNEILEPLRIVMKVSGDKPQWAVDPTKYQHQMNIIGQLYINGILMENPESMVGAFINGECRGVASPEKVRGAAYMTMNVYGIDDKRYDMGKEVKFRIWDASRGVAYTDANIAVPVKTAAGVDSTVTTVIFGQDQMLGNFDKPAIWTKSENVVQLIPIHQNWNWIAFGVEPKSTYLDHVFGAYAEWSMLLKSRSAWNDYNGAQWGDGTLKRAKANEMYKLKIDRLPTTKQEEPNNQLPVAGRQLKEKEEKAVTLAKGWNWIAYTPLTTMTVDEALAAANPQKGDIVKSQTGVAIYGNYGWEGSLKALESGRGYLYYSNADDTTSFLYPTETTASAARARRAALRRAPEDLRIFNPVPLGLYPSNMTMAIQLRDGDVVVDTAEVAAFIGDECRGATRASDNGLYYLVISGDGAGQSMVLRTCLDGDIIDIDNTQMYVSDANIGTSWDPYVIDLKNVLSGISSIVTDDNDDSDWWSIQGFKIGRKPTQPGVYIHHGKKVLIKLKK